MTLDYIKQLIIQIINAQIALLFQQKGELITAREELDEYIGSVDALIEDLEEQKKKFESGGSNEAATIDFKTEII